MRPRRPTRSLPLALITSLLFALAHADAYDCKEPLQLGSDRFDISRLSGEHTIDVTVPTPPTTTKTTYSISLCGPLPAPPSSVPEGDACPPDTAICMIARSTRQGRDDVVVSVVPISKATKPKTEYLKGEKNIEKGWVMTLDDGGEYNGVKQRARFEMKCDARETESAPTFDAYDPLEGILFIKWTTAAACSTTGDNPPPPPEKGPSPDGENGMGLLGWFFTLLFLGTAAYFALGTWHNYTQYGATGWDAIPHRDMWRDLPYVVSDLFKGRGSSRSGYSALG